jgi:transposase
MKRTHGVLTADDIVVIDEIEQLTDQVRHQASSMGAQEVRYLVDTYYQMQDRRKASANQERALNEANEPIALTDFFVALDSFSERKIKQMLQAYAEGKQDATWAMSIRGIGPVLAAGLAAHIDITQAPTVGHIWRFAGLDPNQKWLGRSAAKAIVSEYLNGRKPAKEDVSILAEKVGGLSAEAVYRIATVKKDGSPRKLTADALDSALAVRPFNARLKVLCWKIGESFVKVKNNDEDIYGKVYDLRKRLEEERNESGQFADQAKAKLEKFKIGKDTDAYKAYSAGKLPPAHIHARAKRYAVKLFLAHYHHVAYEVQYGETPPKPYVIEHLGHAHYIAPPNWPM